MANPKHKHRPCPCGCGELADECMRPRNALNAFSISEALATFDAWHGDQREAERDELPPPDALDEYSGSLTATAHPPSECADPYSCAAHGKQYRIYFAKES